MGVLDVVRAPVSAYVGGRISGPALGVLAAADHRYTYPSALFILCEPRMQFDGTVTTVASQEEMARVMEPGSNVYSHHLLFTKLIVRRNFFSPFYYFPGVFQRMKN